MSTVAKAPNFDSILRAQQRISPHVVATSVIRNDSLCRSVSADVFLKLETEQPTGSFKIRGAFNAVMAMREARDINGVTTASTGNHARAVTHAASRFGLDVKAYMSGLVSGSRIRALRGMGADIDQSSPDQNAAIIAAREFAHANGYEFIPPFDHPDVISGQGTIGLELHDALPDLDAVIVPVSGGGLVSGVGLALKTLNPTTQIIGLCAELAPEMQLSFAAGHPVVIDEVSSIAESLTGGLGPDNEYTFAIARRVVDQIDIVSEADIRIAHERLLAEGLRVEPSAAIGAAWLGRNTELVAGKRVAVLITGNAGA